jgi:hypothetical protein
VQGPGGTPFGVTPGWLRGAQEPWRAAFVQYFAACRWGIPLPVTGGQGPRGLEERRPAWYTALVELGFSKELVMYGRRIFALLGCASLGVALNCGGSVTRSDADDSTEDGSSSEGTRSGGSPTGSASGSGQSSASGSGQSSASGNATVTTSGSGGSGPSAGTAGSTSGGQVGAGGAVGSGVAQAVTGMVTGGTVFGGVGGMPGVAVASVTGGTIWPDDIPIPAECSPSHSTIDPYSCYMELTCDNRFVYSYCWDNGPFAFCECDNGRKWNNFQLWGVDEGQACHYAASLCLAEPEPEFTESSCQPTFVEAGTGYCSSQMQCTEALSYEGIRVTRDGWRYVQCGNDVAQGARCSCQFNESYLTLELLETPVSAGLCTDLVTGCSGDLVERKGSPTCTQAYQSASQGYCNGALDCTQDALLDGQPAILHQQVPVNCYQNARTWLCNCPTAGSFEVLDATAWDACTSASAVCASNP